MGEDYSYIDELEERIEKIEDKRTLELIKRLLLERNYLAEVANIDHLTGLNNRRILGRIRECSAVVMCDIDDFKTVNDSYGHSIGDHVIQVVARIIKSDVRETDYVCRFGGDEFFIAFVNCPEEVVLRRLEEIREAANNSQILPDNEKNVTMSFGFSFCDELTDLDDLIEQADLALYESKSNGKNQITQYATDKGKQLFIHK